MASSAEVHATLDHPVIDSDGHMAEHLPTLAPYLEREGLSLDDPGLRRLARGHASGAGAESGAVDCGAVLRMTRSWATPPPLLAGGRWVPLPT